MLNKLQSEGQLFIKRLLIKSKSSLYKWFYVSISEEPHKLVGITPLLVTLSLPIQPSNDAEGQPLNQNTKILFYVKLQAEFKYLGKIEDW